MMGIECRRAGADEDRISFDKESGGSMLGGSYEGTFKFILSACPDDNDILPDAAGGLLHSHCFLL